MLHLNERGRRVLAIGISGSELLKKPGPRMGSCILEEEQYWFPIIQLFSIFPLHSLFVICLQYVIISHLY